MMVLYVAVCVASWLLTWWIHLILQDGRTPLFFAAWYGHMDTVAKLLAKGAAVDATDKVSLRPHFVRYFVY